ncbi:potassium channel SKOR-like [Prosopis cineraria]|uniref:potassium channel SKOR-like n=1 Tax=Prosopis cineraria TaxID=364024 RepID=UPI00241008B9|nr:potassium channel SKOR-like [Prosopis cineraria]
MTVLLELFFFPFHLPRLDSSRMQDSFPCDLKTARLITFVNPLSVPSSNLHSSDLRIAILLPSLLCDSRFIPCFPRFDGRTDWNSSMCATDLQSRSLVVWSDFAETKLDNRVPNKPSLTTVKLEKAKGDIKWNEASSSSDSPFSSFSSSSPSSSLDDREYKVIRDANDQFRASGSRFELLKHESDLRNFGHQTFLNGISGCYKDYVIHPNNRWYRAWTKFILLWAVYSSFFTSMEFGFFRGLPEDLLILDIIAQIAFLVDIVLQFFVAYRDTQTYCMVYKRTPIALRYIKSSFVIDLLGCLPWDFIYKASGRREELRYFLWIRSYRVRRVNDFLQQLEKDIRVNYMFTRILKLLAVELYCTHIAACIFYYLATTLPPSQEGYTWIGSLELGDYSYSHFRDIDFGKRYITSLYFSIVTMATVGYGDIHAVNMREMIFVMIFVLFDMVLGAYLIGNITALIVKGSKTEKFRDKMKDLTKYMNRNRLGRDIREQIKGHVCLQYESRYAETAVVQELPISIRAKVIGGRKAFNLIDALRVTQLK